MNRMTKKECGGLYSINLIVDESVDEETKPLLRGTYVRYCLSKLGKLEDLEEELGIPLYVLFKALKQEKLFVKTDIGIKETTKNGEGWCIKYFEFKDGEPVIVVDILYPNDITHKDWLTTLQLKLKDYGKTWALTKEELL